MRLSVSINPTLLETATKLSGARTKTEAIEQALRALIDERRRAEAVRHAGAFRLTLTRQSLRRLRHRT